MAVDPDDHTLVGDQPWQDLGGQELAAHSIAQTQPILLDPQTAHAARWFFWTWAAIGWSLLAILLIVGAGLVVAMFGTGSL